MLKNLTKNFTKILSGISGKKRLTEENVEASIRGLRLALIEADVNVGVIRAFLSDVREGVLGKEVVQGVSASEVFVKAVHDALVRLLGGVEKKELPLRTPTQVTKVLVSGLQGSGKTTTLGKLGHYYKNVRDVLMVSLDMSRPAAALQLEKLSEQAGVGYYDRGEERNIKKIIRQAEKYAKKHAHNLILYDTAGRTQMDEAMLAELKVIADLCKADENILVLDAMLGQGALKLAEGFRDVLRLDSLIFTKFDSDTSGGAVLSVKYSLDVPVRFVGVGEKLDDLMVFDAGRIAERILGMGDIVGLVERAEKVVSAETSAKMAEKLAKNEFDLADMLSQLRQIGKMGSLQSLVGMIPGMGGQVEKMGSGGFNEKEMVMMRAVLESMTIQEREKPFLLNNSRKMRIARGSGTNVMKVNQTLKKYGKMKMMMKKMKQPGEMKGLLDKMGGMGGMPGHEKGFNPVDMASLMKKMSKNR